MSKKKPLTKEEIEALANSEVSACVGNASSEITSEREQALDYYHGNPFGDEVNGRSQVVSRDVLDTVEWVMPSLMRVFMSGDNIAEFKPSTPEDEEAAEQATDYLNWIVTEDNPGFLVFHDVFKDALLSKTGIFKHWWEEEEREEVSTYTGLPDDAFAALVGDDDVTVEAHSQEVEEELGVTLHDVTIRRRESCGRVMIAAVPPEEFLISSRSKSIADARFVGQKVRRTVSDLVEMGFDRKDLDDLGDSGQDDNSTSEVITRFSDEGWDSNEVAQQDRSMRLITIIEGYLRCDVNDDGIAETVQVWLAGTGKYKLLKWEEVNRVPFSAGSPIRTPHKFFGMSLADLVLDVQRIKSTLLRQMLDNLYLSNNPEREVDITKVANMDDFLMSRPGGIKRVMSIGASREISVPFTAGQAFPMLEYFDKIKQDRTGSQQASTLDAEALQNQTATATNQLASAASQRLELIARILAETVVKDLFKNLLQIVCEHQDAEKVINLRGKWVSIDPREWNSRMDVSVSVGLGHGNRDQQLAAIGQVLALQEKVIMAGGINSMILPKHVYNSMARFVNLAGFKNVDQFFNDPGDAPFPPTQEAGDPNASLAQAEVMKAQTQAQTAQAKMQAEFALKQQDMAKEIQLEREKMEAEIAIEREKMMAEIEIERMKAAHEMQMADRKALTTAAHDEGMAKLNAFLDQANGVVNQAKAAKGDESMNVMMHGLSAVIASMNAPKRVVRGPDGKVAGVEVAQ